MSGTISSVLSRHPIGSVAAFMAGTLVISSLMHRSDQRKFEEHARQVEREEMLREKYAKACSAEFKTKSQVFNERAKADSLKAELQNLTPIVASIGASARDHCIGHLPNASLPYLYEALKADIKRLDETYQTPSSRKVTPLEHFERLLKGMNMLTKQRNLATPAGEAASTEASSMTLTGEHQTLLLELLDALIKQHHQPDGVYWKTYLKETLVPHLEGRKLPWENSVNRHYVSYMKPAGSTTPWWESGYGSPAKRQFDDMMNHFAMERGTG